MTKSVQVTRVSIGIEASTETRNGLELLTLVSPAGMSPYSATESVKTSRPWPERMTARALPTPALPALRSAASRPPVSPGSKRPLPLPPGGLSRMVVPVQKRYGPEDRLVRETSSAKTFAEGVPQPS
ncbi:MAG: hypothetical protein R6X12_05460 [bacterium]